MVLKAFLLALRLVKASKPTRADVPRQALAGPGWPRRRAWRV
jgi:hypothetical protein